eukprot:11110553-Prorocentrum_lima.AAC.1
MRICKRRPEGVTKTDAQKIRGVEVLPLCWCERGPRLSTIEETGDNQSLYEGESGGGVEGLGAEAVASSEESMG